MKTILVLILFAGLNLFSPTQGVIKVTVKDIDLKKGGALIVKVFEKEGFPYSGKELKIVTLKITKTKHTLNIPIAPGTYALAVYQDLNKDGKLNSNFIGIPNEPCAFTFNKVGVMGPPKFEDVCFKIEPSKEFFTNISLE